MKMLPNGNIEITVQLLPDIYASLVKVQERDKASATDVVNLAIMTVDALSELATRAGTPLREAFVNAEA